LPRALGGLDTYNVKQTDVNSEVCDGAVGEASAALFYPNDRDAAADTEQTAMHATD